jgi:hypothetical protein
MQQRSILSNLKEYIVDRWLTWRTGKSKEEREWIQWYEENVVYRASSITNMFQNFKHVIEVDTHKFMDPAEPFAWVPNKDARQYFWPQRPLGNNAVWRFERVILDKWTNTWYISGMGDQDKVFVATNNDKDAIMIALKFMS